MPSPERIGRYRILGELGRGAMGIVYRGRDDDLERDVAIKVMSKGVADENAHARFLREARAAARLQHPNIVVIYELGEHDGAPFMVLELLQGIDLQHALEGGIRPDPRLILPLVGQILAGLGHAHEHGIVHRDVKPSNVFLPVGQPAKIMDFGVSRLAGAGVTTAGALTGTPSYMSPEQISGEEVDGRSDLFSVGLMLYELLTGEKAIQAETVASVLYKIVHETPKLSLLPTAPEWRRLRSLLERTLARRREDRYPDARAMSADLTLALADLGGAASDWTTPSERLLLHRTTKVASAPTSPPASAAPASPSPAPRSPAARPAARPRRPRWLLPTSLAVVAVLVGVGIGVLARRRASPGPPAASPPVSAPVSTLAVGGSAAPALSPAVSLRPTAGSLATPAASPELPPEPQAAPTGQAKPEPASLTPAPAATPTLAPASTSPAATGVDARLARARDALRRSRWAEALAEARTVLDVAPTSAEASAIAQQAESEIVIEECLRNARAALREGDRERALEEVRRGFLIRKNDPRLLEMHREVVQQ